MLFGLLPLFFITLVSATGVHPPHPQPSHDPGHYVCPPNCPPGRVLIEVNVIPLTGVTICKYKSSKGLLDLGITDETICTYFTNTGLSIASNVLNGVTQGCPKSLQKSYSRSNRSVSLGRGRVPRPHSVGPSKAEEHGASRSVRFAKRQTRNRLEN